MGFDAEKMMRLIEREPILKLFLDRLIEKTMTEEELALVEVYQQVVCGDDFLENIYKYYV